MAAIQADSTAAARQRGALDAVMQRALGAEREVQLLKKLRPSGVGSFVRGVAYFGVGVLAGHFVK